MDRSSTINEAWDDFFTWVKTQPIWKDMGRKKQQYIYQTDLAKRKGSRIDLRIQTLLERYGGGRYEFKGVVIIHDEK